MGAGKRSFKRDRAMLPVVCRCCGLVMERSALGNPNICVACGMIDWSQEAQPPAAVTEQITSPSVVLEQFLEWDGPTMMECVEAAEQAKQAIAEADAIEPHSHAEVSSKPDIISARPKA